MKCRIMSAKYSEDELELMYGDVLFLYDFEVITKTTTKNKYESETKIDYAYIIINSMESLKHFMEQLDEYINVFSDDSSDYDLVLEICDTENY